MDPKGSATVLSFLDRVQESSGGSKKFWTDLRSLGRIQEFLIGSKKLRSAGKSFRADPRSFRPSKKIPGGSGKFGAVQKDFGPSRKIWTRPRLDFSLRKRRGAPNQLSDPALFFARMPEEAERCGETPRRRKFPPALP